MISLFDDLSLSRPWEGVLREEEGEEEEEEEGLFKANTGGGGGRPGSLYSIHEYE